MFVAAGLVVYDYITYTIDNVLVPNSIGTYIEIQRRGNAKFRLDGEFFDRFQNIQPIQTGEKTSRQKLLNFNFEKLYGHEFQLESVFTILNHSIAEKDLKMTQNYHSITNQNSTHQNPDHSQYEFRKSFQVPPPPRTPCLSSVCSK